MSMTFESSFSSGYSTSSGSGDTTSTSSYAGEIDIVAGSGPGGDGGLALSVGADATAAGEDTFAQMLVDATLASDGATAGASLSADALAIASGPADPYAAATIWYQLAGPVDSFVQITQTSSASTSLGGLTVTMAQASLDLDAVAVLDLFAADNGWVTPPAPDPAPVPLVAPDEGCGCAASPDDPFLGSIDGNLALYDFALDAVGTDSFASLTFDAIAIENQLSVITAVMELAVA